MKDFDHLSSNCSLCLVPRLTNGNTKLAAPQYLPGKELNTFFSFYLLPWEEHVSMPMTSDDGSGS